MKNIVLLLLLTIANVTYAYSQDSLSVQAHNAITGLIDQYSTARENRDTTLLKKILTINVDQLVSTGEWRIGIESAVQGMMKSSANTPGTRTLHIEKIRTLTLNSAIVDCRYEIQNADNTTRKMWSTFIVVEDRSIWKISAIRNMLPAIEK